MDYPQCAKSIWLIEKPFSDCFAFSTYVLRWLADTVECRRNPMDISSSANASFGSALMTASLAKKQQTQEGEAALKLLQNAAQSAPVAPTSASASLGSKIDIRV
nr:hypothetical protein [Aeromonas sp. CU5]